MAASWKNRCLPRAERACSTETSTGGCAVPDAIWQRQLHSMRGQMLFRVNSLLGQPLVGSIEFVIDSQLSSSRS